MGSSEAVRAWLQSRISVGAVLRQVEQVGDHLERHGERQLVDEFQLAPLGRPIEHGIDLGLDAAAQCIDRRRGERLADEPPQAGVVGRVEVEDRLGAVLAPLASAFEDRIVAGRRVGVDVAAEIVAAQRVRHVVVPGDDGQAVRASRAPATRRAAGRRTGYGFARNAGSSGLYDGGFVDRGRRVVRLARGDRDAVAHRRPVYTAAASATASTTLSIWSSVITSGGQNVSVSAPMARTTTPSCCIRSRMVLASWSARRPAA